VRKRRFIVGEIVDIEEVRAWNVLGEVFGFGIASDARQVPTGVENDEIGSVEMRGKPIRFDKPLLGGVQHVSSPFHFVIARRQGSRTRFIFLAT
jgi:hypothetical protein